MRTLIASAVAVLVAGCASQPKQPTTDASYSRAAAPQSAAVAQIASLNRTTSRNPYPGYKRKEKGGHTVYCKKLSRLGTNFVDEYCMTADELDRLEARAQEDRDQFRRNQTLCGSGTCGD